MATRTYTPNITIHDFEGKTLTNGVPMPARRGRKFFSNVESALKGLRKLPTGDKLITEIENSGHSLAIMCAGPGSDGCAMTNPNGDFAALYNSRIISFRPGVRNLEFGQRDRSANKGIEGRTVNDPSRAEEYYDKKFTAHLGQKQTDANMAPELAAMLNRMTVKYPDPLKIMSAVTGKNTVELFRMSQGLQVVDDDTYLKICVYFYDFVTPGIGCDTIVRLEHDIGLTVTQEGTGKTLTNPKKYVDVVDPRIMLGHELIHAWRMMIGKRVVRSGWEEEAMTTGIAFASGWEMTENTLRSEAGHPRRTKYTGKTDVSSNWADQMKLSSSNA